ncbi:MAG TPA: DUF5994 family protein, partial [Amycolatopsis sp.]|nr:DUF5994 family protein [Amycolatopsis sp.]
AVRPDRIERVTYNLTAWQSAGRRLRTEGGIVRLEGFHMQRPGTVAITGQSRERLTLLVMPPQSRPGLGAPSDDGGIAPGNVESIGELLPPDRPATPSVTDAADVETRRWELDGGRI